MQRMIGPSIYKYMVTLVLRTNNSYKERNFFLTYWLAGIYNDNVNTAEVKTTVNPLTFVTCCLEKCLMVCQREKFIFYHNILLLPLIFISK